MPLPDRQLIFLSTMPVAPADDSVIWKRDDWIGAVDAVYAHPIKLIKAVIDPMIDWRFDGLSSK